MFGPLTEHIRLLIPTSTFTHQYQRQQFTVAATARFWSRSFEQWRNFLPQIIDHVVHMQAEIVKIFYHYLASWFGCWFAYFQPYPEVLFLSYRSSITA